MCEPTNKRHATPIQQHLDSITRPMRYAPKKTEPIARSTFAKIGREWLKWVERCAKSLPDTKSFEMREDFEQVQTETKDLTPGEIADINRRYRNQIGTASAKEIEAATKTFINAVVGAGPAAQVAIDPAILDLMYFLTINASGTEATNITKKAWDKLPAYLKTDIKWLGGEYVYNPAQPWIKKLYKNGFTRVTDAMTKQFVPQLKQIVVQSADSGMSMIEIARTVRDTFGGKLWHWERLVRTEMVISITETAVERYKELGVQFLQWSLGSNACPICTGFRNTVNTLRTGDPDRPTVQMAGVWKIGSAPQIPFVTHPNCRCLWTPLFRI